MVVSWIRRWKQDLIRRVRCINKKVTIAKVVMGVIAHHCFRFFRDNVSRLTPSFLSLIPAASLTRTVGRCTHSIAYYDVSIVLPPLWPPPMDAEPRVRTVSRKDSWSYSSMSPHAQKNVYDVQNMSKVRTFKNTYGRTYVYLDVLYVLCLFGVLEGTC
jgi:hypothetical protein